MKYLICSLILLSCYNLCDGGPSVFTESDGYSSQEEPERETEKGRLKLSPLILSGELKEARELSRVSIGDFPSYSGFLTVNAVHCNSNLFFWFFPSLKDAKTAPLILWHGGGPGTSGLVGLFTEHGPFYVPTKDSNSLRFRNTTWITQHSVIYIDSPVGSGFSYTDDDDCFCESSDEAAKDVYEALIQFFAIFPEFRKNDFFVSSGSYGGKFVPAIGFKIHLENQLLSASKQHLKMNLKGMTIASGFTDPINQIDYGDFYYSLGLITEEDRDYFNQQESLTKQFIKAQQWEEAFNICEALVIGCCFPNISESYFGKVTGYTNSLNLNNAIRPPALNHHVKFVQLPLIREALHVGNGPFDNYHSYVYEKLKRDIYQSLKSVVEELLNAGYKFLIYSGQLDLIVPHTTVNKYLHNLKWKDSDKFNISKRRIWTGNNEEVFGYVRSAGGLTYALIRNAGHKISFDQPKVGLEMISEFTRNKFFSTDN